MQIYQKVSSMRLSNKQTPGLLFIAPHFIGLAVVYLLPFIVSIWMSLQVSSLRFRGFSFDNYMNVIRNSAFQMALKNNLLFMIIGIAAMMFFTCILSYWLWELKASPWLVLAFVLPICVPSASVIGFFRGIINMGNVNLLNTNFAMAVVIIIYIWKHAGYTILIFMNGLGQIPREIFESAHMEGATRRQVFKYITLPELIPAASFGFIVSVINSYKVYKEIYLLEGRYPNNNIYMLQNYLNNKAVKFDVTELAAASNLLMATILLIIGIVHVAYVLRKKREVKIPLILKTMRRLPNAKKVKRG
jgi:multiple sugar transport system permease protein